MQAKDIPLQAAMHFCNFGALVLQSWSRELTVFLSFAHFFKCNKRVQRQKIYNLLILNSNL